MHIKRLTAIGAVALLLGLVSGPSVSFAHERRTLAGGKYDVVVGWDASEPVPQPASSRQQSSAAPRTRIAKVLLNPSGGNSVRPLFA